MRAERRQASRAVAGAYGRIFRRVGGPALLTLLAGLAGAWGGEAHAQAAPTLPKAIPDYGDNSITISWVDNANDETGFEIERTEGANVVTYNAAANAVSYKDATPATDKEYSYRVRAIKNAAASAWTAAVAQNVKTVWPVPGSHEILHNWNETIGSAGVDEQSNARGFHMGVDIQRLASPEPVVAVRGGVVAHAPAAAAGAKENYVIIKIQVGANVEYASYNHLDPALLVVVNDVVKAGQAIGKISELTFIPPGWVQHTHFFFANPWHALDKDPLSVFAAAADKDPQGKKPALTEHNTAAPDGTMLYRSQGAAGGVYFAKDLPISGHVDIIAELADELGTNPDQVPTKVGYWIEPPTDVADCPAFHGVKTAAAPYLLYEWSTRYMGDYGGLARSQAIVDYSQNLGPLFIEGGKAYRWENYKHFVVTNTKGADAAPDSIDEAQYWNTKARQDGGAVTIATANYAGKPDATRPTEARFPDGVYKIHLIASDLVNANEALAVQEVRVENFCPIVCQCEPRGLINCPATVAGFVTFNEAMDVSIAPADIVKIDSGATLTGLTWVGETKITFTIRDLRPGETYNLRVKGAGATPARDKPPKAGTPGNALDGDKDGVCGDDYIGVFSCGTNNNNNNNNNNANANNNNGNDNLANNNNGNNNNGNGNNNNGNGNNNNGNGNNNNSNNNNGNNNNGNGPPATLIELFGFGATTVGDGRIELAWQTGSERGTVGYNVLRSAGDDLPRVRLNARLIPARGAETVGARYAFADSGVAPNVAYRYWLQELESDGRTHVYGPVAGRWELRFALQAPYPNPFRQAVLIPFSVPVPARVTMRIFDVRGRLLREFNQDKLAIGSHVIRWDGLDAEGRSVANGIYFARMTAADFGATRKLVLIR